MPVRYAGDHTAVIKIDDRAVVPHIPVIQEQICEIRTPFLVRFVCMEILIQQVLKYLVWFSRLCSCFFGAYDGVQTKFRIHVFVNGCGAVVVSRASQVNCHAAVAVHTVVAVINVPDLFLNLCFLSAIVRLTMLPVVIIGIGTDLKPPQQPTDAEFFIVLFDESINL